MGYRTTQLNRIADSARQILEGVSPETTAEDIQEARETYAVVTFHRDTDGNAAIGSETSRSGLLKSGVESDKKGVYWLTFDNEKKVERFLEKYRSKIAAAHMMDKNPANMQ